MPLELLPPLLHLDRQPWPPQEIGEFGPAAHAPDAEFERRPGFLIAAMPERLEQPVTEDSGLALLIAPQRASIIDELPDRLRRGDHRALSLIAWADGPLQLPPDWPS